MINKSKKILSLMLVGGAVALFGGNSSELHAQVRDPFSKPGWAAPKTSNPTPSNPSSAPVKSKPVAPAVVPVGAPPVQDRINHFMRLREQAALSGQPLPKPTLVLTMDELALTGIFKTPRGYAATVQAVPINLSYTIYPGEKVFDGQLVAIEENRLVFRKVTKMSNGKFIASEQSKTMRQYSDQEVIQNTAPIEPQSGKTESANNSTPPQAPAQQPGDPNAKSSVPGVIVSPVDEMNRQIVETPKSAKGKSKGKNPATKKPVKVAKNKDQ